MTDANLLLGYLDADFFLGGEMALDRAAARSAIQQHIAEPLGLTVERAAYGIHAIISEDVARAFRVHASERGFDYRRSSMVAFGGCGPLHAMGVARRLGIPRVVFPVAAGVMSALGLLASPLSFEVVRTHEQPLAALTPGRFSHELDELAEQAMAPLIDAGVPRCDVRVTRRLDMRYHGQGHEIEVTLPASDDDRALFAGLRQHFVARYRELYAFAALDAPLTVVNWKVEASAVTAPLEAGYALTAEAGGHDAVKGTRRAWFGDREDYIECTVWNRYALGAGERIVGPALIEERESTVLLPPGEQVSVDEHLNLVAELASGHSRGVTR